MTLTDFNEKLWSAAVEKTTVSRHGKVTFTLMDGTEI